MSQAPPGGDDVGAVVDLVDTLEELVGSARRLPFTPSVVVNEEEILELVDRIRLALPDDLVQARHTLEEREEMIDRAGREAADTTTRAEEEAERLVREARAHVTALVDEHAITRAATERANAMLADADRHATAQRVAADDYAREVMERLEEALDRWLATVREGLQALPGASDTGRRRKR